MELGLKNKVVIITGGARGLGRLYALAFSEEGAKVAVCDILDCGETVKSIEARGEEVLALKADLTSKVAAVELAKKTAERFGKIDVLVNNAGIYGGLERKSPDQIGEDEWDKVIASHAKSTFLCCEAVFPYMKEQGGGKIINVSSAVIFHGSTNVVHYATAKGAILVLSRALARQFGPYNINVNVIAPGLVLTQASMDWANEAIRETNRQRSALQRDQKPESPVGAVLFFASKLADDITGQSLIIDCGISMQ